MWQRADRWQPRDRSGHGRRHHLPLLAVPARRDFEDPTVLRGKQLFVASGCASCHTPRHETGVVDSLPELSNQTIRPFTDLLLHDLGDDLADNRPDFLETGREWRTPPLWGVGLVGVVNGHTTLLHDGRARDLTEAILWHGGEAEPAREEFRNASAADRAALVRFLESL
ncbi:MAG: di-heme oxidoredictase family protein [Kofleriaceae bacterium]